MNARTVDALVGRRVDVACGILAAVKRSAMHAVMLAVLAVSVLSVPGCSDSDNDKGYSQAKPDELLRTAALMVRNGEPGKITTLIYADSREMRAVLNRLGKLLDSMQKLAATVAAKFPEEVAKIRASVEAAAGDEANQQALRDLASRGVAAPPTGGPAASPEDRRRQQEAFEENFQFIFADPFGWLDKNAARLTAESIDDETSAVLLDGKPLPVPVTMKLDNGKWYLVLPLNIPGVDRYLPETINEWRIVASLMRTLENAMIDLEKDVASGKVTRMEGLAERAGELVYPTAGMVVIMYVKEMDVRTRRERAMRDFRPRLKSYLEARHSGADPEDFKTMSDLLTRSAQEGLDKLVRLRVADREANPVPKFAELSDDQFATLVEGWLAANDAPLSLASTPTRSDLQAAVKKFGSSQLVPVARSK